MFLLDLAYLFLYSIVASLVGLIPSDTLYQEATNVRVVAPEVMVVPAETFDTMLKTDGFTPYSIAVQEGLRLPLPVRSYTVTSSYGWRAHPITGAPDFHKGLDFGAPYNTPLYAIADGVVTRTVNGGSTVGGDLTIESVVDGVRVEFRYHHMENVTNYVREGDSVKAGQLVTRVASTGISTGAHLHLEVRVEGVLVNPEDWFRQIGLDIYGPQR